MVATAVCAALNKKPGLVGRISRWWLFRSTPRKVVARYEAFVVGFRAIILHLVERYDAEYQVAYSEAVSEAVTLDFKAIWTPGSTGLRTKMEQAAWLRSL